MINRVPFTALFQGLGWIFIASLLDPNVSAQVADPVLGLPSFSNIIIEIEEFAQIPESAGSAPRARINHLKPAGDGSGRLFVNDLRGLMYLVSEGSATLYLDLDGQMPAAVDAPGLGTGFTSFAFDPEFASNGIFYTAHSEAAGSGVADFTGPDGSAPIALQGVITEWTATTPSANVFAGSRREVLRVDLVHTIHGMQEIAFNPNSASGDSDFGMLYICIGDSGTTIQGYPNNTHRLDSVLGTILRIDPLGTNSVNGAYGIPADNPWASDGDPDTFGEIWAYGFRNPHRISWDTAGSGMMLSGDIGERNVEELNLIEPGRDYGWNEREGTFVINRDFANNPSNGAREEVFELPLDDDALGFTYPVAQYGRDVGVAIVSGFVYRGELAPILQGKHIFGDIKFGDLFAVDADSLSLGSQAEIQTLGLRLEGSNTTLLIIVSNDRVDLRFGYDEDNELYLTEKIHGKIYKVTGAVDVTPVVGAGDTTFVNIATRGFVGSEPGEELIGGFVLVGDNPQQVLIRGLGPDLIERGVTGVLADPIIEVRNFAGDIVLISDDWSDEANASDIAAAIAQVSSDPSSALEAGSADAAMLVTLEPNDLYTVIVRGKDGATGIALMEVFEID